MRAGPSGRVHAKVLPTDSITMLGSTNWTNVSQQNEEWTVAIEPNAVGLVSAGDRFDQLWRISTPLMYMTAV